MATQEIEIGVPNDGVRMALLRRGRVFAHLVIHARMNDATTAVEWADVDIIPAPDTGLVPTVIAWQEAKRVVHENLSPKGTLVAVDFSRPCELP